MIGTITLNPSVDKRYIVDDFEKNGVFRAKQFQNTAGGKGINVARVVKLLGEDVITTGFLGGKNGEIIEEELGEIGVINEFVRIKGETRNCIAILSNDASQTEILEPGPLILDEEIDAFFYKYDQILKRCNVVCASGSIPKNLSPHIYTQLIEKAKKNEVKFLLDTSGKGLIEGINAVPYLVKPNRDELKDLTGISELTEHQLIEAGKRLQDSGINIVVISLGSQGSMVFSEGRVLKVSIPKIKVVNPVGSGDSMIAGFAVALDRGYDIYKMIKFASACGTANAMEDMTGRVNIDNVNYVMSRMEIDEISL